MSHGLWVYASPTLEFHKADFKLILSAWVSHNPYRFFVVLKFLMNTEPEDSREIRTVHAPRSLSQLSIQREFKRYNKILLHQLPNLETREIKLSGIHACIMQHMAGITIYDK